MKALIDGDIFRWEFGSATDDEYKPLSWPLVQSRIQAKIDRILEDTGADSYQIYLTSDDKSNFRFEIASIRPYKGNRATEKPYWYQHIRNFLVDYRGAQEVSGQEADDAMAIAQYQNYKLSQSKTDCGTVICSKDKDLNMVPGWHYNWGSEGKRAKGPWYQDELGGLKCFYKQLLTGDPVDNIPGLYGVSDKSSLLRHIENCTSEAEMYRQVLDQYEKRFGSYAEQFLLENGRLLWMRREENELWKLPNLNESRGHS